MGRHDWYRNKTWDDDIESAFEERFARSRQPWSRWQYLTIQAGMLARSHPDVAESLYRRSVELDGAEPGWISVSYRHLGEMALRHNDRESAIGLLRESVQACPPKERGIRGPIPPERLLIQLLWFGGPEAREEATSYLEDPEGPPEWGSIPDVPKDPGGYPYEGPEDAAESLLIAFHVTDRFAREQVDALFAADPSVLSRFDEFLLTEGLYALFHPWSDHGRWELPAYIGRCLVRNAGAEWEEGEHLVDWRIRIGDRHHELYPEIWHQLQRGVPIRGIYESLAE